MTLFGLALTTEKCLFFDFGAVINWISQWNYSFWITVPVFNLISLSCNVCENSKLKLILWLFKSSWDISFNFDDCSWAWDGSAPVTKCIFWIFEHLRITSSQSLKKFTIWWWALDLFWQFLDFCFPFSIQFCAQCVKSTFWMLQYFWYTS